MMYCKEQFVRKKTWTWESWRGNFCWPLIPMEDKVFLFSSSWWLLLDWVSNKLQGILDFNNVNLSGSPSKAHVARKSLPYPVKCSLFYCNGFVVLFHLLYYKYTTLWSVTLISFPLCPPHIQIV